MKVITIGRGTDCQVVLDDPTISRRHAILKVYPLGKMELVDMSQNGTFVNGVKLSPNVPYPVSRKDVVSFAHVSKLDWDMIPNPLNYVKYAVLTLLGISLIVGVVLLIKSLDGREDPVQEENVEIVQPAGKPESEISAPKDEKKEKVESKQEIIYPKLPDASKKNKKEEKVKEKKQKEETKPETQPEEKPKKVNPVYV